MAMVMFGGQGFLLAAEQPSSPYGLDSRPQTKAYLLMPPQPDGALPRLLSQTGAFRDTRNLAAGDGLIPYDLIIPFWSDGATKLRWMALPAGKIKFAATGEWAFPKARFLSNTLNWRPTKRGPDSSAVSKPACCVCDADGGVYGVTYKWRADDSDADLLATNLTEAILIQTATGVRTQLWYYPSRQDCLVCHTANAGYVLGVKTRQLNRDFTYPVWHDRQRIARLEPSGVVGHQVVRSGFAGSSPAWRAPTTRRAAWKTARVPTWTPIVRNCHRPDGTVAYFDARYDTPLASQNLIGRTGFD